MHEPSTGASLAGPLCNVTIPVFNRPAATESAVRALAQQGIRAELINIHTIKPLDEKAILDSARKTGAVVTAEEHLITGGLGEKTASLLARYYPVPMRMVAMAEGFGQSGKPSELMEHYGLNAAGIIEKVRELR